MQVIPTRFAGLFILEPKVFGDHRGYFFESYRQDVFEAAAGPIAFVQDNESMSNRGILRGLHFQNPPYAQGKLVRVVQGAVLDVAVDVRKDSPTYGEHIAIELSAENKTMLYVPPGFAHGFYTLQDQTIFQYKCTGFYHPQAEVSLAWNDPHLAIQWPDLNPILSAKDVNGLSFSGFSSPF